MSDSEKIDLTNPAAVFGRLAQLQLRDTAREVAMRELEYQREQDDAEWDALACVAMAMLPVGKTVETSAYEQLAWKLVRYAVSHHDGELSVRELIYPCALEPLSSELIKALSDADAEEEDRCLTEDLDDYLPLYKRTNPDVNPVSINGDVS